MTINGVQKDVKLSVMETLTINSSFFRTTLACLLACLTLCLKFLFLFQLYSILFQYSDKLFFSVRPC